MLEGVVEFADIARPRIGPQAREQRGRDLFAWGFAARKRAAEQKLGQRRNVFGPFAQRGQFDRDHAEAIVEVFAEGLVGDQLFEVAVGGRDDAHVDVQIAHAAEPLKGRRLDDPQQFRLKFRRRVADLVQKNRAAVGQREKPLLLLHRPRERALLVAEQVGLDHVRGADVGRQPDFDKWLLAPLGKLVDLARDEALTRPRLAAQKHNFFRQARAPNALPGLAHQPRVHDQIVLQPLMRSGRAPARFQLADVNQQHFNQRLVVKTPRRHDRQEHPALAVFVLDFKTRS